MTHNNERDELARAIFVADNYLQKREAAVRDFERFGSGNYAHRIADGLLAAGYVKPRQVNSVEELDALPIRSIVAAITHSRNVPIVIVFQRGSIEHGGDGWCTPEAIGQIPSEAVFEFIALNGLPTVFTVLTDGGSL